MKVITRELGAHEFGIGRINFSARVQILSKTCSKSAIFWATSLESNTGVAVYDNRRFMGGKKKFVFLLSNTSMHMENN